MRLFVFAIFTVILLPVFGQSALNQTILCYPYENKQVDTVHIDGLVYVYKIMQTRSVFEDGKVKVLCEVILPDFYADSDKMLVQKVVNRISKFTGSNEFALFNDCKAREYYYSCKNLQPEEYKYFEKHFVGYYKSE